MNDGYQTRLLSNGQVIQSGTFTPSIEKNRVNGFITRAVVLRTYFEDDNWSDYGWAADFVKGVFCDVRTYGMNGTRFFFRVPVLQSIQGLHDCDLYIPRDSRINLGGGQLVTEESPNKKTTPSENLDGDHVLLTFLECDVAQPVILPYQLPHPNTPRELISQDNRFRKIRFQGSEFLIDQTGNITLDATGASEPNLAAGGKEISASGSGGEIEIKTADGDSDTLSIKLNSSGDIEFKNGGSTETITLKKSGNEISISATQKVSIDAVSQIDIQSITNNLTGTTNNITGATNITGAVAIAGGFAVTPGAAPISLGSGGGPLVSFTNWLSPWTSLGILVAAQLLIYAGPVPPPTVSVSDYAALLASLQSVISAYSTTATTQVTAV